MTRGSFLSAVEPDLQRVRAELRELWKEMPPPIQPLVQHGALDGGKMLRPALLLLWGQTCGAITRNHVRAAAILELLHNASLLHDDVLDEGCLRRGVPTINRRWGNHTAVLLGDLLLGTLLEWSTDFAPDVRTALSRMVLHTCDGEIRQTSSAGNFALSEQDYLAVIGQKTAAMFEGACHIGASLAGSSGRDCLSAARFGRHVGMAYQIMDDFLDIAGDDEALHKTLGTDLRSAKPTLPVIHALRVLPEPQRASLRRRLRSHSATAGELLAVFRETGSTEYVLTQLHNYTDEALGILHYLPQTPAKTALMNVPQWIIRKATEGMTISDIQCGAGDFHRARTYPPARHP